jgi:hypothetical protein
MKKKYLLLSFNCLFILYFGHIASANFDHNIAESSKIGFLGALSQNGSNQSTTPDEIKKTNDTLARDYCVSLGYDSVKSYKVEEVYERVYIFHEYYVEGTVLFPVEFPENQGIAPHYWFRSIICTSSSNILSKESYFNEMLSKMNRILDSFPNSDEFTITEKSRTRRALLTGKVDKDLSERMEKRAKEIQASQEKAAKKETEGCFLQ